MSKYYTPTIEEFHVGFECEILNGYGAWKHISVEMSHFKLDEVENLKEWRVKYLDREDIESLGWLERPIDLDDKPNLTYTKKLDRLKRSWDTVDIIHNPISNWVVICLGDDETGWGEWCTVFAGTINNKSELKRILKQIEI